jgi:hypothetical protein
MIGAPKMENKKYVPPVRQSGIPPTMRVIVELGFVQSCPDCLAIAQSLAASCLSDASVASFKAVPGRKHAHEVTEGSTALPGLAAEHTPQEIARDLAALRSLGDQDEQIDRRMPLAISDTNGMHPDLVVASLNGIDVAAFLQREMGVTA